MLGWLTEWIQLAFLDNFGWTLGQAAPGPVPGPVKGGKALGQLGSDGKTVGETGRFK